MAGSIGKNPGISNNENKSPAPIHTHKSARIVAMALNPSLVAAGANGMRRRTHHTSIIICI